jgi:hypothetical protein
MKQIMPFSPEIAFFYCQFSIFRLPAFLSLKLIRNRQPSATTDKQYTRLEFWADEIEREPSENAWVVEYLQSKVEWDTILPYCSQLSPDTCATVADLWKSRRFQKASYSIRIELRELPPTLFKYMPFQSKYVENIFGNKKLYLSSPSDFNDPFDCSLDESYRLSFIEWGIGCFSSHQNHILMFSHYADKHRGICIGFDSAKLAKTISAPEKGLEAHIRPVWYVDVMPPLAFESEPALCATCKHGVWGYEDEYRLFMVKDACVRPSRSYAFDVAAISSVVFGYRASDHDINLLKSMTFDQKHITYYKACRQPGVFGLEPVEIRRIPQS